ncbi:protein FAR1-RELATED SEQUENCE 5 [Setaria viridis]|uniref:protein FAR1-RELATED SEQUENCE 5 n=1 Tax=Setaria viridis TaxID=4556 RepID=UPI003B3B2E47
MLSFCNLFYRKATNVREEHADDINKLIEFFKDCEAQNPQFRWEPKLDSEGVIHSLFWSHASMQGDYADFGDAMSFDTTHKTNIYEKPLAMFVGSNHHLQNTLFGCALVGDETAETFEWVFKAFKKCMGQIRTRCILTDQDQAMGVAIAKEFPGVVHKICRWHVVNKHMPHLTNLFGMYAKKNFKDKFYSVLNHPLTPVEFEAAWQELLDEFDLQKDGTLDSLYCQRQLYVPVYFKDQYCGRMASTQRSESSNFVMKKCFVNKHTALHRFAKKMLDFMHSRKMKESEESYHGMSKRLTRSKWPFEIQVSRIYTRNVFKDFEKKMIDCTAYDIEDNPIEGETCYLVTHTNRSSKISWGQHQFKVRANKENGEFHCECKEWQHTGLFCVHLLRAFMRIQLNSIPQHYILRRYTKYAQQELGFDRNDKLLVGADGVTQLYRIKDLTSLAMAAVRSGSMSRAAHIRTREVLAKLDKDNKEIPPDIGPSTTNMHQESPGEELSDCSESDDGYGDNTNDEQLAKRVTQELGQANVDGNEARESIKGKMVLATNLDAFGGEFVRNEVVLTNQTDMTTKDARVHEGCAPHSGEYHANDDRLISRVPPTRSKTKGRSIPPSEKKEITLGAKGVKKGTRKCSICGYYATHNARTCPKL